MQDKICVCLMNRRDLFVLIDVFRKSTKNRAKSFNSTPQKRKSFFPCILIILYFICFVNNFFQKIKR